MRTRHQEKDELAEHPNNHRGIMMPSSFVKSASLDRMSRQSSAAKSTAGLSTDRDTSHQRNQTQCTLTTLKSDRDNNIAETYAHLILQKLSNTKDPVLPRQTVKGSKVAGISKAIEALGIKGLVSKTGSRPRFMKLQEQALKGTRTQENKPARENPLTSDKPITISRRPNQNRLDITQIKTPQTQRKNVSRQRVSAERPKRNTSKQRGLTEFLDSQLAFQSKKQFNLQQLKNQVLKQSTKNVTFHPHILKNPKWLTKNNPATQRTNLQKKGEKQNCEAAQRNITNLATNKQAETEASTHQTQATTVTEDIVQRSFLHRIMGAVKSLSLKNTQVNYSQFKSILSDLNPTSTNTLSVSDLWVIVKGSSQLTAQLHNILKILAIIRGSYSSLQALDNQIAQLQTEFLHKKQRSDHTTNISATRISSAQQNHRSLCRIGRFEGRKYLANQREAKQLIRQFGHLLPQVAETHLNHKNEKPTPKIETQKPIQVQHNYVKDDLRHLMSQTTRIPSSTLASHQTKFRSNGPRPVSAWEPIQKTINLMSEKKKAPVLYLNVNIDNDRTEKISIYEGDEPNRLSAEFCAKFKLQAKTQQKLAQLIKRELAQVLWNIEEEDQNNWELQL